MIKAQLIDHMGSDLTVVNAARVSFDKESEWLSETEYPTDPIHGGKIPPYKRLSDRDTKLINYLATHEHWSPFAHATASFRVSAPIFVARQLQKHTVGLAWNEVSRRYVDSEPTFYTPDTWRARAPSVKQGSSDEAITILRTRMHGDQTVADAVGRLTDHAGDLYKEMIEVGVCPEQARMVLPQSMMTEWIWTGSLYAFARVCKLRLDSHTQYETRLVTQQISDEMARLFPVSWNALVPAHGMRGPASS